MLAFIVNDIGKDIERSASEYYRVFLKNLQIKKTRKKITFRL